MLWASSLQWPSYPRTSFSQWKLPHYSRLKTEARHPFITKRTSPRQSQIIQLSAIIQTSNKSCTILILTLPSLIQGRLPPYVTQTRNLIENIISPPMNATPNPLFSRKSPWETLRWFITLTLTITHISTLTTWVEIFQQPRRNLSGMVVMFLKKAPPRSR